MSAVSRALEVVRLRFLHRAADVRVADEEVHGGAEEVREADERADVPAPHRGFSYWLMDCCDIPTASPALPGKC